MLWPFLQRSPRLRASSSSTNSAVQEDIARPRPTTWESVLPRVKKNGSGLRGTRGNGITGAMFCQREAC
ncbi:hypothetical protein DY000_02014989 [Brassica cretica]|uniref:Uncharacterized protein n=1 Tax=Brassica cretica TaxID=69181 RepID=A0ABQ7CYL7_BRACR|nr:hypothetical protein DY000_02014989 [Brassica cretica]